MSHKDEFDDSIGDAIIIGLFKVILGIGIFILVIILIFVYCGDSTENLHLDDPIDTVATDTAIEDTTK